MNDQTVLNQINDKEKSGGGDGETKSGFARYVPALIAVAVLVAADQVTKYLAAVNLADGPFVIIPGVFELRYLENRGAAFGILQNQRWFFIVLTGAFLVFALWFYGKIPRTKRMRALRVIFISLMAGAIGNMIDRAALSYVRDFFYFSLIDFPIFNMADICVTVAAFFLFIYIIFVYKESDFDFLKKETDG